MTNPIFAKKNFEIPKYQVAPTFKKFIGKRLDKNRSEGKRMVA